ncbi:Hypothetical predicted protein [Pelobates cultripes]|uniref:Uncharacterized protein n=1 Tax=Pelobates cultripes TaxID=61616 RepID=A0AAD1WBC1_PELCU|nr:Hypothetical predicted protein [Pelobates cultripes]
MATADQALGPPLAQPQPEQQTNKLPYKDNIAAAFDHFWMRWWDITQTRATTKTSRPPTRLPAQSPAPKHTAKPMTGARRQEVRGAKPRPQGRTSHTRRRQPERRQHRRATLHSPPLLKAKRRHTRRANTRSTADGGKRAYQHIIHQRRCKAATSSQKDFDPTFNRNSETLTRRAVAGEGKPLSRHSSVGVPAIQSTHVGLGNNGGDPPHLLTRGSEDPWDFPVCALPEPTTGVG